MSGVAAVTGADARPRRQSLLFLAVMQDRAWFLHAFNVVAILAQALRGNGGGSNVL